MKKVLVILSILMAVVHEVSAQQSRTVSLQSVVADSVYLNVQLSYVAPPEDVLKLDKAFLTKRGQLKREKVETGKLNCKKKKGDTLQFDFSLSFEFQGRRYRAQGRYADNGEKEPDCSLRCVPMRLSDKTLRESEYSDKL
jgi:hypothetical protein